MKRLFLLPALVLLLFGGLAACGGEQAPSIGSQLSVSDFAFAQLEDGSRVFSGKVYNPTEESVRQVQLRVSLLDADNQQIGTTNIAVSNLAPKDTTAFREVLDSSQKISSVRMSSLTVM